MPPGTVAPSPPTGSGARSWRQVEFAALDFETTGLDLRTDEVVSFGVVPITHGRIAMRGAVHQLVAPPVPPSPRSQTIHQLRPQDLAGAPDLVHARERLRESLEGRFLLVWFAEIELHFLRQIFGGSARRWRRRTIDVRNLAIAFEGQPRERRQQRGYALSASAERHGVPVADAHDALDDALVTAQLFLVLATGLRTGGQASLRNLRRTAAT
ncbi:MAG TPA: exonuclease domain-containing protein [Actinomycetota bacterium]